MAYARSSAEFRVTPGEAALHDPGQALRGIFAYYAVPTNYAALADFRAQVIWLWRRALRRRSQKDGTIWDRMAKLDNDYLPKPRILHPWPNQRFAARHPR